MYETAIAYFSRTGHTKRVAELLAKRLDARIIAVVETVNRRGIFGYLRSAIEALRHSKPEVIHENFQPERHRLVLIGTPVWAGRTSSPIRAFVHSQDWSRCELAFYGTMGGSGGDRVFEELQQMTGRKPIATLALTDADVDAGQIDQQLDGFCTAIQAWVPKFEFSVALND